tara:strand:- start:15097 stop:15552 length:456 start_codon:yes stop_codon:yes gene_type:complete
MIEFEVITVVEAPPDACFDLSRDLDFHQESFGHTDESIVGGRASGLIGLNEEVTWRARHFGFYHEHTARITALDSPRHFRDEMTKGRFLSFVHDHYFEPVPAGTRMRDVVEFQAPMGIIGRVVEALVLKRYMHRLIASRSEAIRVRAESGC